MPEVFEISADPGPAAGAAHLGTLQPSLGCCCSIERHGMVLTTCRVLKTQLAWSLPP